MMKKIFAIAGAGVVGRAVGGWLESLGIKPLYYDPLQGLGDEVALNKADVIFVCVPTPYIQHNGYDDSAVCDVLSKLKGSKMVIVKSTVLPGSTDKYQKTFSHLKIIFNPEFLVQKQALADFLKPTRQIVGYTPESQSVADEVLKFLPSAEYSKTMKAIDAEMIKYFGNLFLATKVVFANQMYDLAQAVGADYDVIMDAGGADPRIGRSHLEIWHDGYRGYAGACLPKDVQAVLELASRLGVKLNLIETVHKENRRLLTLSKKSKNKLG